MDEAVDVPQGGAQQAGGTQTGALTPADGAGPAGGPALGIPQPGAASTPLAGTAQAGILGAATPPAGTPGTPGVPAGAPTGAVDQALVEQVIAERVRPVLRSHGGDVSLDRIEDGIVHVKLHGECLGCPAADLSMRLIVKEELTAAVPGIADVVLDGGVSDELIAMARTLLHRPRHTAPPPRLA